LKNNLPTVAVLAHGLDRIYPSVHRYTAMEMLQQGGLLTDFPSGTNLEKFGFVRRNRIVAGLSDATVVTESPEKGGSLITADIAFSYGREVFSFPGRTTDVRSQGCNTLIRQNKAALITSAADLALALGWETPHNRWKKPVVEPRLPFPGDETYEPVLSILRENREIHINQLATTTGMPVNQLTSLLFELELNDRVKVLPGGIYRWV
jgi:DNA processing protein